MTHQERLTRRLNGIRKWALRIASLEEKQVAHALKTGRVDEKLYAELQKAKTGFFKYWDGRFWRNPKDE